APQSSISKVTFTAVIDSRGGAIGGHPPASTTARQVDRRYSSLSCRLQSTTSNFNFSELMLAFHRNALQLPDRFAADNRARGTAFEFPATERSVARQRFETGRIHRPFQIRVNQCDVGVCADRQRTH